MTEYTLSETKCVCVNLSKSVVFKDQTGRDLFQSVPFPSISTVPMTRYDCLEVVLDVKGRGFYNLSNFSHDMLHILAGSSSTKLLVNSCVLP